MARVFTISYEFMSQRHIAMVTMSEALINVVQYNIKLFNQDLYSIIPDGKISFTSTDNALPAQVHGHVAEALFFSVKTALLNYLSHHMTTAAR